MSDFFMVPLFLAGALLAAIPVVIHLFFQRKAPQVFFSTIRFLQQCVRKTARRKRIENLLLLIFRMLLFGLLAVALAKPFFRSDLAGGTGPATAVIVLDNSYSMATRHQGVERLTAAKELALKLVRGMSDRDSVALLLTGGPEAAAKVALTRQLNDVHAQIAQAEIFDGRTDLVGKINQAYDLIRTSTDVNREIIVLTDLQANALDGELAEASRGQTGVPLIFYDCGQEAVVNLAVTGLTFKPGGRLGKKLSLLEAEILNPTDYEVPDARVTLYVDKALVRQQKVKVKPHARTTVSFSYPFAEAKSVTGWVQLSDDPLARDNTYYFRVGARDKIRTLVLREAGTDIAYLDDAYYLVRALAPRSADETQSASPIDPREALLAELGRIMLSDYQVVFLVNVRELAADEIRRLRRFVETGGMLVFFTGDRVEAAAWDKVFDPGGTGLFPAKLREPVGDAQAKRSVWQMTQPEFEWRGLKRLKSVPPALFERVRTYRFFPISDYDDETVRVLLQLSADDAEPASAPLLASARLGKGEVFFFSVPATTGWTNFPATKVFVPMLHEMIYAVTGEAGKLETVVAGEPKRFDFRDRTDAVTVKVYVAAAPQVKTWQPGGERPSVEFLEGLHKPGIYRYVLVAGTTEDEDHFVVNPYTEESELTRVSDAVVADKFAQTRFVLARTPEQFEAERRRLREGHPLSGYVFLLLIAVAALELFMANRTRPARAEA